MRVGKLIRRKGNAYYKPSHASQVNERALVTYELGSFHVTLSIFLVLRPILIVNQKNKTRNALRLNKAESGNAPKSGYTPKAVLPKNSQSVSL